MVYLELFWSFLKIGFTSFGGLSMIPLISEEVLRHGWMTASQVTDIVAIAEMTPGSLGFNCATFAGMQAAGVPGAFAANFGVMMPALTLTVAAALFLERFKDAPLMKKLLMGVRPACLGMILGLLVSMAQSSYFPAGRGNLPALAIGVTDAVLLLKFKRSIPQVILCSAAMGLVIFGLLGLPV